MMNARGQYSVAVYATPMSFPLNFTIHSWVEISDGIDVERYDLWGYPGLKTATKQKGYLYKNIFPDHLGTTFSPFAKLDDLSVRQTGKVLQQATGGAGSVAHTLFTSIKEQAFNYPAYDRYNMILGPSCNTYTQWLLDLVPEAGLSLPWYAWGRGTKV